MKKIVALVGANLAAALALIYLLSPGLFDVFSQPPVWMLLGLVVGFGLTIGALWLDYKLLFAKQEIHPVALKTDVQNRPEEYTQLLRQCLNKPFFRKDLEAGIDQIARFEKKQKTIQLLLKTGSKINADKCLTILTRVSDVFYENVRALATRAIVFDEDEYALFRAGKLELATEQARRQKEDFYTSVAQYTDEITNQNEEIILRIDQLSLELTRANTANKWDTDSILAMQHLDEYIRSTELTQNLEREVGEEVCSKIRR